VRPLQNVPFCPISVSDSAFCTKWSFSSILEILNGMSVVKIFVLTWGVHAPRPYGQPDGCPIPLSCGIALELEQN